MFVAGIDGGTPSHTLIGDHIVCVPWSRHQPPAFVKAHPAVQDGKRDARGLLSRGSLLGELQGKGILNLVPPEVKAIHALLEQEFNPLELCLKLVRVLPPIQPSEPGTRHVH